MQNNWHFPQFHPSTGKQYNCGILWVCARKNFSGDCRNWTCVASLLSLVKLSPGYYLLCCWEMARRQWSCGSVDQGMTLVTSRNTGSPEPDIDVDSLIEVFWLHWGVHFYMPNVEPTMFQIFYWVLYFSQPHFPSLIQLSCCLGDQAEDWANSTGASSFQASRGIGSWGASWARSGFKKHFELYKNCWYTWGPQIRKQHTKIVQSYQSHLFFVTWIARFSHTGWTRWCLLGWETQRPSTRQFSSKTPFRNFGQLGIHRGGPSKYC